MWTATTIANLSVPGGAPPVVDVSYSAGTAVPAVDVTVELIGETVATNGNAFINDPPTGVREIRRRKLS
jgi:hypothetical protein